MMGRRLAREEVPMASVITEHCRRALVEDRLKKKDILLWLQESVLCPVLAVTLRPA